MVITKRFVLLNFPKNGSTYLRTIIKKIDGVEGNVFKRKTYKVLRKINLTTKGIQEIKMPSNQSLFQFNNEMSGQHGTYSQIPVKHRSKKILYQLLKNINCK